MQPANLIQSMLRTTALLAALTGGAWAWRGGWLRATVPPVQAVFDTVSNTGPNNVDLDDQVQNYYEGNMTVDRDARFQPGGTLAKLGRLLMGRAAEAVEESRGNEPTEATDSGFLLRRPQTSVEVTHFNVPVRLNRWGHRANEDYDLHKPAGVCRIAYIGSSNSLGHGVRLEESFLRRVEARLKREFGGKRFERYELINISCFGYHILERLFMLDTEAAKFEPDLILFEYTYLDMRGLAFNTLAQRFQKGRPLHFEFLDHFVKEAGLKPTDSYEKMCQRLTRLNRPIVQRCYDEIGRYTKERMIPVCVVGMRLEVECVHPDLVWQAQVARKAGLDVIGLFDAYEGQPPSIYLNPRDRHPGPKGHGLLADELYKDLLADPLARKCLFMAG